MKFISALRFQLSLLCILQFHFTFSSVLTGSVIDGKTKEPLIGAVVFIKELNTGTSVNLSGNFSLKIRQAGNYTILCSYIGYKSVERIVTISSSEDKIKSDFDLFENANELNEIVVQGVLDKSDDAFALRSEKNAEHITNVMSAKTIQLLPDITVGNIFNSSRPFSGFNTGVPTKSPEALYGPGYQAKVTDFGVSQLEYKNQNMPVNSLMSLSIGNRFMNDKLGIIVAGSYQNIYRGTNSIFYKPDEPAALPYPNTYQFQEVQIRQFSNHQKRLGLFAKLDYPLNKNNKIAISNFFSQLSEAQHRNYYNPLGTGAGLATNDVHDRSKFTVQRIFNSTLNGDHFLFHEKFKLNWTLAYSRAASNTPAWSDMNVRYRYNDQVLQSVELLPVTQQWTNNSDEDKTGYLNLTHSPVRNLELMTGGMARFKTRSNVYTSYELGTLLADGSGNYQAYTSIDQATFNFLPASNAYANPNDPNNYTAKENIISYYLQGKYNPTNKLQILGGARIENTIQEYHSQLSIYKEGREGKITYSDILPSLHFNYTLSPK